MTQLINNASKILNYLARKNASLIRREGKVIIRRKSASVGKLLFGKRTKENIVKLLISIYGNIEEVNKKIKEREC